jgi:NADP-dependent 3-hydroxy acid dehydrogenase YdfG
MLVACAGLPADALMDISDAGWRQVIDSNLSSYLGCSKRAIERIRNNGRADGQVILVGSISVHIKAIGESVYNASKGGVALFAETLRKEMIKEKIRVTLIEPGAIATHLQPYDDARLHEFEEGLEMLPAAEVAEAILFAATRPPGVDVVTLRIEPLNQKIW